jgi:DivIVA domain-containing protein
MTEGRLAPEEVRTRTFTRVVRGYRRREVRRLLERAAAGLDRLRNGPGSDGPDDRPALTAEQVEEARFQPALGGYEMDEVDKFLDEVVAELERAAREPFRPASALPAPARQAPSPAATPGPPPSEPDFPPVAKAPPPAGRVVPATPPPPAPPAPEPAPVASDEGFSPPPPDPSGPRAPVATASRPLTPSEVETRTFEQGAPGYLPSHVDLFLAKAARALAGRDGETLTRWDVLRQRFPLGPRGYATNQVDAFLVRLAAQFPDPDPAAQQEILRKLQGG